MSETRKPSPRRRIPDRSWRRGMTKLLRAYRCLRLAPRLAEDGWSEADRRDAALAVNMIIGQVLRIGIVGDDDGGGGGGQPDLPPPDWQRLAVDGARERGLADGEAAQGGEGGGAFAGSPAEALTRLAAMRLLARGLPALHGGAWTDRDGRAALVHASSVVTSLNAWMLGARSQGAAAAQGGEGRA